MDLLHKEVVFLYEVQGHQADPILAQDVLK